MLSPRELFHSLAFSSLRKHLQAREAKTVPLPGGGQCRPRFQFSNRFSWAWKNAGVLGEAFAFFAHLAGERQEELEFTCRSYTESIS